MPFHVYALLHQVNTCSECVKRKASCQVPCSSQWGRHGECASGVHNLISLLSLWRNEQISHTTVFVLSEHTNRALNVFNVYKLYSSSSSSRSYSNFFLKCLYLAEPTSSDSLCPTMTWVFNLMNSVCLLISAKQQLCSDRHSPSCSAYLLGLLRVLLRMFSEVAAMCTSHLWCASFLIVSTRIIKYQLHSLSFFSLPVWSSTYIPQFIKILSKNSGTVFPWCRKYL